MPEGSPARIGRYEVRGEIGRGMMGVVYEAWDPDLSRTIALKTIQLGFVVSEEERQTLERRFFVEARAAARLSHPAIVTVHDVGRDADTGGLYIALEYVQGRTLEQVLKERRPLEWRRALEITRRIAEALEHAHGLGVVHRDIKPANIMLQADDRPKVMDFGIAKIETAALKLTRTGQFFGTPLYMAPEQALARSVDARADVFSLGAILYALLTARDAFAAANITKIIFRVVHEDPTPPSQVAPELPPALDYVVARALAKDPASRYAGAGQLGEDMDDVLAGRPPRHREGWTPPRPSTGTVDSAPDGLDELGTALPRSASEPTRARPRAGRHVVIGLGVAAAVLVVLALAGRVWLRPPTPADAPSASAIVSIPARPPIAQPSPSQESGPPMPATSARATSAPATTAPTTTAPTTRRPAPAPAEKDAARLFLDVEHSLQRGTLRLWIDGALALTAPLRAQESKKLIALRLRKGRLERKLTVRPGHHAIRVSIAWDDDEHTEDVAGDFEAGAYRILEVRLRRLPKDLSVKLK